jgi:hypothetical protein
MTGLVPFLLRYDADTLRRSTKGSITGNLYVELGTFVFPDRGWSDFVVVILGWWLEALSRLIDDNRVAELEFMDGPYAMRATAVDLSTCTLECLQKAGAAIVLSKASVDVAQMFRETQQVAAQLVKACDARSWRSPDVDALKKLLTRPTSRLRRH